MSDDVVDRVMRAKRRERLLGQGATAVRAATPEYPSDTPGGDLTSTLVCLMHYADAVAVDFAAMLGRAHRTYEEHEGIERQNARVDEMDGLELIDAAVEIIGEGKVDKRVLRELVRGWL